MKMDFVSTVNGLMMMCQSLLKKLIFAVMAHQNKNIPKLQDNELEIENKKDSTF